MENGNLRKRLEVDIEKTENNKAVKLDVPYSNNKNGATKPSPRRKNHSTFRRIRPAVKNAIFRLRRKLRKLDVNFIWARIPIPHHVLIRGKHGLLFLLVLILFHCAGSLIRHNTLDTKYITKELLPRFAAALHRFQQSPHPFTTMPLRTLNVERPNSIDAPILINLFEANDSFHQAPAVLKSKNPDYGDLNIDFLSELGQERKIINDPTALDGWVWTFGDYEEDPDSDWDGYHSFDDEYNKNSYFRELNLHCRYVAWHRNTYPNCNTFHEIEIIKGTNKFLGGGSFRAAFLQHEPFDPNLVVKVQLYNDMNPFDVERFEFVRMDAIVMERLTASPRIVDMYGHCASSVYSEYLPNEAEEQIIPGDGVGVDPPLRDEDDVDPKNNYTISEKLDLALQMAEAIADIHGYHGGVIIHDDIQLAQFLFRPDGSLVLNDFNRAEAMLYDEEKGEYCKYTNGPGGGDYRSPEEYHDNLLNEKIDVWSFGNNIYGLITGLWVFYQYKDEVAIKKMMKGEKSYLDPRYRGKNFIQDELIELMYKCWHYEPDKRADIFEAVTILRDILEESKKRGIYDGRF